MRKVEKVLADTPGVKHYSSITGYSLLDYINATYFGFFFVSLEPWGQRRTRRDESRRDHGLPQPPPRADRGGAGLCLPASRHRRCGHVGRLQFHAPGPRGAIRRLPGAERRSLPGGGPPAARADARQQLAHRPGAPGVRQRGPRQGAQAGGGPRGGLPDPQRLHGHPVRELLQPVRAPVAGVRRRRGRVPDARRGGRAVLRPQQARPDGPPLGHRDPRVARGARVHEPLQRVPLGGDHRRRRPRLQFRPGHGRPGGRRQAGAPARHGLRVERALLPAEPRGPAGEPASHLRDLPARRLPHPGRAVRELGPALRRAAGHAHRRVRRPGGAHRARVREQRVRADRAGDAHRALGKERRPHRGVRAGRAAPGSADRGVRPHRRSPPPAPDSHDGLRLHLRGVPPGGGLGLGRRGAADARHGGGGRHAGGDHARDLSRSRDLFRRGARGARSGAGTERAGAAGGRPRRTA